MSAKLAVSVLGLEAVGWVTIGPLLRLWVERADIKEGGDCAVGRGNICPCCTVFIVVSLSRAVALIGTSLRPLGGREGQNPAVCLVGWGEESLGRPRLGWEDEPMTVWASKGWRREMRKPRKRRDTGVMVGLWLVSSDCSLAVCLCVTTSFRCVSVNRERNRYSFTFHDIKQPTPKAL